MKRGSIAYLAKDREGKEVFKGCYLIAKTKGKDWLERMKKESDEKWRKNRKTFRLCLVTVFVFYFQKLVFENKKKKKILVFFK